MCKAAAAQCLSNAAASAVGCCYTTDCNIYTACLPHSLSGATTALDMDRTLYWYVGVPPGNLVDDAN